MPIFETLLGGRASGSMVDLSSYMTYRKRRSNPTLLDRKKLGGGASIVELGIPISPPIPIRGSSANLSFYDPETILSVRTMRGSSLPTWRQDVSDRAPPTRPHSSLDYHPTLALAGSAAEDKYTSIRTVSRRYSPSHGGNLPVMTEFGCFNSPSTELLAIEERLVEAEARLTAKRSAQFRLPSSTVGSIAETSESEDSILEEEEERISSSNDLGWGFPQPPKRYRPATISGKPRTWRREERREELALDPFTCRERKTGSLAFPSRSGSASSGSSGYAASRER